MHGNEAGGIGQGLLRHGAGGNHEVNRGGRQVCVGERVAQRVSGKLRLVFARGRHKAGGHAAFFKRVADRIAEPQVKVARGDDLGRDGFSHAKYAKRNHPSVCRKQEDAGDADHVDHRNVCQRKRVCIQHCTCHCMNRKS